MLTGGRSTLTQFLIEERRHHPDATGDLNALITDVSLAAERAVDAARRGAADSLCLHGDSPGAVAMGEAVRTALLDAGLVVGPFVGAA
jgi:lactam utilization protein B